MDNSNAIVALSALAQDSRLSLFRRLVALGPEGAFAGELADHLQIPANTLSFHLKTLSQAGLVSSESLGRHVRYRADFERMQALLGFLSDHCCDGQPQHCAPLARNPPSAQAKAAKA